MNEAAATVRVRCYNLPILSEPPGAPLVAQATTSWHCYTAAYAQNIVDRNTTAHLPTTIGVKTRWLTAIAAGGAEKTTKGQQTTAVPSFFKATQRWHFRQIKQMTTE